VESLGRADAVRLMGLLDDIVRQKSKEVVDLSALPPPVRPQGLAPRDVAAALGRARGGPLKLIAEIKFRSPSAGPLSRALSADDRAAAYEAGGASMVSVLTDARWFEGSFADLRAARAKVRVPVLCKDFVIHPVQIDHAWAAGADAVLVIVRCLAVTKGPDPLRSLVEAANAKGIEPFVEVVDEHELERALAAGARVIGVNTRDLDTLEMDPARAARVLASIPPDKVAVHLSGLKSRADAAAIAASRADAALIGEALMRQDDPGPLLSELVLGAAALT
jgi:indole-3-glycerol phosphate synthase